MNIKQYNFTQNQLNTILALFKYFHSCNHDFKSNCKVDGVQTFIDKNNDFYASYCLHELTDNGGFNISLVYIKIDTQGVKEYLNDKYENPANLGLRFAKMQEIKIN